MIILIVEDTEDSRVMLEMALSDRGYEVLSSKNGTEALNLAEITPPDLIISDIMMPEMDGFELCRQLKLNPKLQNIPIIFYTATYTEQQDEDLAMALGASRFVTKPQDPQLLLDIIEEVFASSKAEDKQTLQYLQKDDIELKEMHLHSVGRKLDKKVRELVQAEKDLQVRKKELLESEQQYRDIFNSTTDALLIYDLKGNIKEVNPQACKMYGYKYSELIKLSGKDIVHPDYYHSFKNFNNAVHTSGDFESESVDIHKDGTFFDIHINGTKFNYKGEEHLLAVVRDITERKIVEKELRKLSSAVQQSPSIISVTDLTGNLTYVNPKFTELTGYSANEVLGKNPQILKSGEQPYEFYENLWQRISTGKVWRGEFHNKKKNGEFFWEAASISPILDDEKKIISYLKVAEDVTEKKEAEEQIKKDLEEKKVLLQEIHHRTKNNMSVISAMLSLQARKSNNEYVKTTFKEIMNKIKSMSLVHQKLYKTKDLSNISLKEYTEDLLKLLINSYKTISDRIAVKYEIKDVNILIDTAIPFGLILNELISNVFKHAFPNNKDGEVNINLFKEENFIHLLFSDNGIGAPEDFDTTKNRSVGLNTVYSLAVTQLGGDIKLDTTMGFNYHIMMRADLYKVRI